jgi:uncharacterized protein
LDFPPSGQGSTCATRPPSKRPPAHAAIRAAFEEAGARDVSVHRGIMGFDRSSGVVSARPLRFHTDQPLVVEAVGSREQIEAALPTVREVLERGLITLTDVALYAPER